MSKREIKSKKIIYKEVTMSGVDLPPELDTSFS